MGSAVAFSNKKASVLLNNLIKNRHSGISFAILAQSVKSVTKNIRANCNLFFIGKFASKKIVLQDMYEQVSNVLTEEQFEELSQTEGCTPVTEIFPIIIDGRKREKLGW